MNTILKRAARGVLVLSLTFLTVSTSLKVSAQKAQSATPKIVKAASAFLATLNEQQRKSVMFAYNDEAQRARWFHSQRIVPPPAHY